MKIFTDEALLAYGNPQAILRPHFDSEGRLNGGDIVMDNRVIGHADPCGHQGVQGLVPEMTPEHIAAKTKLFSR